MICSCSICEKYEVKLVSLHLVQHLCNVKLMLKARVNPNLSINYGDERRITPLIAAAIMGYKL